MQENYRTLMYNLDITKKAATEEMQKSKEIEMDRDKINYQISAITKICECLCSLHSIVYIGIVYIY